MNENSVTFIYVAALIFVGFIIGYGIRASHTVDLDGIKKRAIEKNLGTYKNDEFI